ncbi:MAG: TRAP transporter substrate-binding protein [Candidatus Eremiobacteraeota bacterium]|nr:TRAP transporter substrate-binding protein [Candidatus Eremiobacteraeota bacterium]
MKSLTRKTFATATAAGAASAFASIAFVRSPARAAQFTYKYGNDQTDFSPLTRRMLQMWQAVERETGGKLHVDSFPNSVLGGDTQMIVQLRSGALHFLTEPGALLQSTVPAAAIDGVGFAFKDTRQAFGAMDGELGEFVRKEIEAKGMVCIPPAFDNGMRQITANKPVKTVSDVEGLKIRVPSSALFVDMWKSLGSSPTPINVSELYSSLQTHIVEAQENALINIEQSKLYEVQKTLNFSNHAWSCWWMVANKDAWDALGADIQQVVRRNVAKYAPLQRTDFASLTNELVGKLKQQGMAQYTCDVGTFKAKLGPYYAKWKKEFGPTAWGLLEKYTGTLG